MPEFEILDIEYDAGNPDHVRRWLLAGSPDVNALDSDGRKWRPTVIAEILPDKSRRIIPAPEPNEVDIYRKVFVSSRQNATLLVDSIKAAAQDALVKSGAFTRAQATAEGVEFVYFHGDAIAKFKEAGGHPLAAQKLKAAFLSTQSVNTFRWVSDLASLFEGALTY